MSPEAVPAENIFGEFPPDVKERLERHARRVANDPEREQRIEKMRELIEAGWFDEPRRSGKQES